MGWFMVFKDTTQMYNASKYSGLLHFIRAPSLNAAAAESTIVYAFSSQKNDSGLFCANQWLHLPLNQTLNWRYYPSLPFKLLGPSKHFGWYTVVSVGENSILITRWINVFFPWKFFHCSKKCLDCKIQFAGRMLYSSKLMKGQRGF